MCVWALGRVVAAELRVCGANALCDITVASGGGRFRLARQPPRDARLCGMCVHPLLDSAASNADRNPKSFVTTPLHEMCGCGCGCVSVWLWVYLPSRAGVACIYPKTAKADAR